MAVDAPIFYEAMSDVIDCLSEDSVFYESLWLRISMHGSPMYHLCLCYLHWFLSKRRTQSAPYHGGNMGIGRWTIDQSKAIEIGN